MKTRKEESGYEKNNLTLKDAKQTLFYSKIEKLFFSHLQIKKQERSSDLLKVRDNRVKCFFGACQFPVVHKVGMEKEV
jgi:hypothetical protein